MEFSELDYVVLIVEDLDRTIDFYTKVMGLTLGHRSGEYAQFKTGSTRLSFYTRNAMAQTLNASLQTPSLQAPGFEIGFKTSHVDQDYLELINQGVASEMPPTTRVWGQRTAYLRDPDGHLIELAQDLNQS